MGAHRQRIVSPAKLHARNGTIIQLLVLLFCTHGVNPVCPTYRNQPRVILDVVAKDNMRFIVEIIDWMRNTTALVRRTPVRGWLIPKPHLITISAQRGRSVEADQYGRDTDPPGGSLASLCSPGTWHKAGETEGPRVCSSTIGKGESSKKKASSAWSAESITDAIYRTKFLDVPDIIADWTREYGGIAGRDVLDFGCGEATMALAMALRHGARRVVAVEIHEEIDNCARYARQQLALERLPANLELKRIAADTSLDVFGSFDVVYSWSVFEHVSQELIGDCFAKIRRVLRPDGIMFLQTTPLFYSSEGSHFKPWVPEPWAHLSMQQDRFLAALRAAAYSQEQADHLWRVYMTLNRATAPNLLRAAANAGFEVIREYRTYDEIPVPEHLLEVYTREALTTQQLVFLARATS